VREGTVAHSLLKGAIPDAKEPGSEVIDGKDKGRHIRKKHQERKERWGGKGIADLALDAHLTR